VDGQSGMCRYFDPATNLCTIYPVRPTICNIEKGYALYFKQDISWEDFVTKNLEGCKFLQGLSKE